MEYSVLITKLALRDIEDVFHYIAVDLKEPQIATKLKNEILICVDSLSSFPLRNKLVEEEPYRSKGIRRAFIENYSVMYQIIDQSVLILRVVYNRRDWQSIL